MKGFNPEDLRTNLKVQLTSYFLLYPLDRLNEQLESVFWGSLLLELIVHLSSIPCPISIRKDYMFNHSFLPLLHGWPSIDLQFLPLTTFQSPKLWIIHSVIYPFVLLFTHSFIPVTISAIYGMTRLSRVFLPQCLILYPPPPQHKWMIPLKSMSNIREELILLENETNCLQIFEAKTQPKVIL